MGRIVIVDTGLQSVVAMQDFLEVKLGAAQFGLLHSVFLMQTALESPALVEELPVSIKRASGSFTSGSGGSSATVVKGATGDAAHGLATTERNNTTQAVIGTGALDILYPGVFSMLAGEWERTFTPELRPPFGPSEAVIFSLDEVPTASRSLRAVLVLEIWG